ncbi:RagB/SusD family nutrient uptake outer membrane protein [Chitinophaga sp. sic0106]|uniref:RagB/SusD family nutrient uptake outer membrane protein n=1 Tax=Chitinophaga sp. sic0106 TaxID=2854785 RepID=UPI001C489007|nr:RagB/SusD family nutrient uptake outer membrane protein [Chitinophaga sp. sic0106]MBV7528595.1 RagB/SusD family nutrient uptake outer membrane protein [Chitinophaga sp. sic0106]
MKRNYLYIAMLALVAGTSCSKYLEHAPDQRAELNTPEKVAELLTSAYPRANYFAMAEARSDNQMDVSVTGVQNPVNSDSYFWRDVTSTSQDGATYYWNACYAAIAAANQALEVCNSAANPKEYEGSKGEALLARAYAHFMLVTLYSKAYDPVTAATDPGVPYVTVPESVVIKQYDRKTVAYVYEMIEKDITEGMPLINDKYVVPAYHFTRRAAHGFASRFYLWKRDWAKVVEEANAAFPNNDFAANVRPWLNYQGATVTTNDLQAFYTNATNPGNLLLGETVSSFGQYYPRYQYAMTQPRLNQIIAPMGVGWSALKTYSNSSTFYFVMKYLSYFKRTNLNATTGTYYTMVPLLTTEEVLLNRAEALLMSDKYPEALDDMNTMVKTRINNFNATTQSVTDAKILKYYETRTAEKREAYRMALLDIKRAEFVSEGMRWLDILRLQMPVTHTTSKGEVFELAADDKRKLLQLPEEVTLSGIPLNPR